MAKVCGTKVHNTSLKISQVPLFLMSINVRRLNILGKLDLEFVSKGHNALAGSGFECQVLFISTWVIQ